MKKIIAILSCAALLCGAAVSTSAQTNDPVVDKVLELAAQDNQTMDHLDVLCNTLGGRLTGSDNYNHAVDWALYMFRKWGLEAEKVHSVCGNDFVTVTPGVRFADGDKGDQVRVMTPAEAKKIGSDYIVVGRPITAAPDPVAAYKRCVDEFIG